MRPLKWSLLLLAASGCWNFDEEFARRCRERDGGFTENLEACGSSAAGGGNTGGGSEGGGSGGGATGGGATGGGATGGGATGGGSGGGATGGGSGGGATGGSSGGGVTDGGLTRLPNVPSGCIGVAPWCWESPRPGVGNDLFAISGTADDDVYLAGAGPTLLRFDGTNFIDLTSLLPQTAPPLWSEPPVIRAMVNDADGVWLIGERIGVQVSNGGAFTPVGAGLSSGDWTAIVSFGGFRYLARGSQILVPAPDGGVLSRNIPLPDGGAINSLFVDAQACIATTLGSDPTTGARLSTVVDCRTPRVLLDNRADGGSEGFMTTFRLGDGGLAVGTIHGNLFEGGNGTTWVERQVPQFAGSYAILTASATPTGTLVTGGAGFIVNADTGAVLQSTYGSQIEAAWTSPDGTFWGAGRAGVLVRENQLLTTDQPTGIRAAYVDELHQYAVSQSGIFERTANTWPRRIPDSHQNWVAITALGDVLWLIDGHGQVFTQDPGAEPVILASAGSYTDGGAFSTPVGGISSAPPDPNALHLAAALTTRDGGVFLASGRTVFRAPNYVQYDFSPGEQIVALAEVDGGVLLATTERVRTSTDLQTWDNVLLGLNNRRIEAVTVCPNGRIVAAGRNGMLELSGVVTQNGPPSSVNFSSVWCAPDNTIWALTTSGYVVHRTAGTYVNEYPGWGHERNSTIGASFIGGNSTHLFIMGDDGAILSRPLP